MLLNWSRRDAYALGFGPFPIIFSMNLFLRFRDDWFYLQFVMIAVGLLAKELIRWKKDGRLAHIFNPSSFPLAVFSIALMLTGATRITWGPEIATTQFYPPHIYLFLFLVALPGQILFGVTTMTMSAVVTTYLFGVAYFAATGTYFFIDDYIPIAVFLGMQLLFTDPSTSPRSELGRVMFGVIYGLSVVAFYAGLEQIGAPTFYDKLLPVPFMNLAVRAIESDRGVQRARLAESRASVDGAGADSPQPRVRVGVGVDICRDERARGERHASRPLRAVLAARVRRQPPGRVPRPGGHRIPVLRRRVRLVVQRTRHVDGERPTRPDAADRTGFRAGVRAGVSGGLFERKGWRAGDRLGARGPGAVRLLSCSPRG